MATSASDQYIRIKHHRGQFLSKTFSDERSQRDTISCYIWFALSTLNGGFEASNPLGNLFFCFCPSGFARSALVRRVSLLHNPNTSHFLRSDAPTKAGLFDFRAPSQNRPCHNMVPGNHSQRCRENRPDLQSGWIQVRVAQLSGLGSKFF